MDRNQIGKRLFFWYAILWVFLFTALYLAYGVYFIDTTSTKSKWVVLFAGAIALLLGACKTLEISFYKSKNPLFEKITRYFTNGSFIFTKRLFKITLFFVSLISCFLIKPMGLPFVICFVCGSVFSFASLFLSIVATSKIATRSSQFYNESNLLAIRQIFNSGVVIATLVMALSTTPLVVLFHCFKDYQIIFGFVLGAALVAVLNNISTVTSRQAVDCANEVICRYETEFEKNDRRNPLLLLNGITKSILSANIMPCDLFVSFCLGIVAAMAVGADCLQLQGAFLPLIIAGSGIFACVIAVLFTKLNKLLSPVKVLFSSAILANIVLILISYFLVKRWLPDFIELVIPVGVGAFSSYLMCFSHINYIYLRHKAPVNVSNSSISGFTPTLRQTIKEAFGGVLLPAIILALCVVSSFLVVGGVESPSIGLFGILIAVLSMVCCTGFIIAINSFGLTIKNVDVVLETYEEDICEKQNILSNSLGDFGFHMKSLCSNFINAATILTSIGALIAYSILAYLEEIDLLNPYVLGSLLIGCAMPFLYCSSIMGIVTKCAKRLSMEVKEQLKRFPQILRFEMRPNYEKCVDIAALNSCIQVLFNSAIVIAVFFFVVIKLQTEALAGFVLGTLVSSFGLLYFLSASSTLSKSAKKHFENHFNYIKNDGEYSAISQNEAIFRAFGGLIVPTLNALIKFLAIAALALIPLFGV